MINFLRYRSQSGKSRESIRLTVEVYWDDEEGYFVAECVEFPGTIARGSTEQEALDNVIAAVAEELHKKMLDQIHDIAEADSQPPFRNHRRVALNL